MDTRSGFLLAALMALGAGYATLQALRNGGPPPGLHAKPAVINLGKVDSKVHHLSSKLKNNSLQPLRVVGVVRSCSCTSASISSDPIEPGASIRLDIEWDARGLRKDASADILVVYEFIGGHGQNDREGRERVTVHAQVVPDIDYEPEELVFKSGLSGTQALTLHHRYDRPIEVNRLTCDHVDIAAHFDQETQVVVVAYDSSPQGVSRGTYSLRLSTDSEGSPSIEVPIRFVDIL